jgi:hypothetical protein
VCLPNIFALQSDPCHGIAGARSRAQQKLRDLDELGIDVELFAVHAPPPAPQFNMVCARCICFLNQDAWLIPHDVVSKKARAPSS